MVVPHLVAVVTWTEVALAVLPASATALLAYFGIVRAQEAETNRLRTQHREDQRRERLTKYHAFLSWERITREYIRDQAAGKEVDVEHERNAQTEWYRALYAVQLFGTSKVRKAFEAYRSTLDPMGDLDLTDENPDRWTQMTDVLMAPGAVGARRELIDAMHADANEGP